MAKYALIGNPIAHSKSPALFKAAYCNSIHSYTLLEAATCKEAMQRFANEGFTGTNVTSPFKDEVMEYISFPDRISSILSSANTVMMKEGKLHSWNTDYYGVKNSIAEFLPANSKVSNMKALTIGAGGAGKAAALALKDMGFEVFFANRSAGKAKPFAEKIGVEYIPLEKISTLLKETYIIVYNLSIPIDAFTGANLSGKIVFEANYAHPNLAGKGASTYIDGRYWLYNQAIPAFRIFTGEEPDTAAMRCCMGL